MVRRISFGITTRPRSSILLTIPVAFMFTPCITVYADFTLVLFEALEDFIRAKNEEIYVKKRLSH